MGMNFVVIDGLMDVIVLIVGWILERDRPRRRMAFGAPWARSIAV